jgi:hypothetical protein
MPIVAQERLLAGAQWVSQYPQTTPKAVFTLIKILPILDSFPLTGCRVIDDRLYLVSPGKDACSKQSWFVSYRTTVHASFQYPQTKKTILTLIKMPLLRFL